MGERTQALIAFIAIDMAVAGVFALFGVDFFDGLAVMACISANSAIERGRKR